MCSLVCTFCPATFFLLFSDGPHLVDLRFTGGDVGSSGRHGFEALFCIVDRTCSSLKRFSLKRCWTVSSFVCMLGTTESVCANVFSMN